MAGLALGIALSGSDIRLHSYGVCDSPTYFYKEANEIYRDLGALNLLKGRSGEDLFSAIQAKGAGYAMSRPEELQFIKVRIEVS